MHEDTPAQPYLMMRDPDGNMARVPLEKLPLTMGRRSSNLVQVLDPTISRDHCQIVLQGDEYVLEDLGSTHGTYVNQERIQRHVLKPNDRIRLGGAMGHLMTFRSGGEFTMLIGTTGRASISEPGTGPAGRRGSTDSLRALLEISKALNSSLRLTDVLEKVMDAVIALTDGERCLMLLGSDADALEVAAQRGLAEAVGGGGQYSQSVVREVFSTGEAQILTDVAASERFSAQQSIVGMQLRTVMCVPLRLSHFSQAADEGDASARILGVLYVDRRSPTRHFSDQDLSVLESFAGHAAIAIDNARLYEEALEKRRMDEDLRVARRIQRSLLLSEFPELPWADVHAFNLPSRGVGGDYYELFEIADGSLAFAVGDVSGKGIPAAMLMATLQAAFLAAIQGSSDLTSICAHINQFLVERTSPERYATFFVGLVRPSGELEYVNAGHNPALVLGDGGCRRLMGGGLPLGLFRDRQYELQHGRLAPGDVIACFSDGVTEANDPHEAEFGEERLIACVQEALEQPARAISKAVLESIETFSAGAAQHDDLTLMLLRYRGE